MSKGSKKNQEPGPDKKAGLPFVPERWPSYEAFNAAFTKAAQMAREQREHGYDEDGSGWGSTYKEKVRFFVRYNPVRIRD